MENQLWESKNLGISFSFPYGRIYLFRTTLKAIGLPPYYRFLLDPENRKLAIERCGFESDGSHQLPEDTSRDCYSMKSMDLVRFIYNTCGWDKKSSYRIKGIAAPDQSMVVFDLASAFRVQERHIVG